MAQRNLRAAADAVARHPRHAPALGADLEEAAAWRDAAGDMVIPWDEALGSTRSPRASPSHECWDFDDTQRRAVPAAAALPVLRPLSQAGREAGRPRARPARPRRRVHRRAEGPRLRRTTSGSPYATPRSRPPRRRSSRPRSGTSSSPTTTSPRPRSSTCTTSTHNTRDGLHIASLAGAWHRRRRRLRRAPRPRRPAQLRAAASGPSRAARVPPRLPGPSTPGGGDEDARHLPPPRRRAAGARAPREDDRAHDGRPGQRADPTDAEPAGTNPASRARPGAARQG